MRRLRWLCSVTSVLLLAAATGRAQEDCFDFSRYTNCPTQGARCLLGPDPDSCAQDCASCTPGIDDDLDCAVDEELLNDKDDDGDGLIDEDISCLNTCPPQGYQCPAGNFDRADYDVPDPIAAPLVLPARVNHWGCVASDDILDLNLELAPDPGDPRPYCGGYILRLRLLDRQSGALYFEGPALAIATRRWETLAGDLVAGAAGNVEVFRYVVRAELKRIAAYAQLPPALKVPCNEDQATRKHLFFFGHIDVARDAAQPLDRQLYRTAMVLTHSPGRFTHTEASYMPAQDLCGVADVTLRPIPRGDARAHDDQGWFIVAPGDKFRFSTAVPLINGNHEFGRIRQVPRGVNEPCPQETQMCESMFEDPGPIPPCTGRVNYRNARFCGQDTTGATPCPNFNNASLTKCNIIPNHRIALLPVGAWDEAEFPGKMSVAAVEGGLACRSNFEAYWYGSYTALNSPGVWLGPPDAIDVVDNQLVRMNGAGKWLLGSVNWFMEGMPNEMFRPVQFRTMYFFSNSNPDIPTLAPCAARAVAQPSAVELCRGGDLNLVGSASKVTNCCQCGGLQLRWLRRNGAAWDVVQDWSQTPDYRESPGPLADAEYRLEVRCSTSKRVCIDATNVTVRVHQPFTVDAGPNARICAGSSVALNPLMSGGTAPHRCGWTPAAGLSDPAACTTTASPAATTTYQVDVLDAGGACAASDTIEIAVDPLPIANAGGPGPLTAPARIGVGPCDPLLQYSWTPPTGLDLPLSCNPTANPMVATNYCLVVRDPRSGCESLPDCVDVRPKLCDPAAVPGRIARLLGVRRAADVHLEWNPEPQSTGGYHAYRVAQKVDIPSSLSVGVRAITTPPGVAQNRGDDVGAVPALPVGSRLYYQVVGLCSDGQTEGPL